MALFCSNFFNFSSKISKFKKMRQNAARVKYAAWVGPHHMQHNLSSNSKKHLNFRIFPLKRCRDADSSVLRLCPDVFTPFTLHLRSSQLDTFLPLLGPLQFFSINGNFPAHDLAQLANLNSNRLHLIHHHKVTRRFLSEGLTQISVSKSNLN